MNNLNFLTRPPNDPFLLQPPPTTTAWCMPSTADPSIWSSESLRENCPWITTCRAMAWIGTFRVVSRISLTQDCTSTALLVLQLVIQFIKMSMRLMWRRLTSTIWTQCSTSMTQPKSYRSRNTTRRIVPGSRAKFHTHTQRSWARSRWARLHSIFWKWSATSENIKKSSSPSRCTLWLRTTTCPRCFSSCSSKWD